jgi:hypothetical protein
MALLPEKSNIFEARAQSDELKYISSEIGKNTEG